MKIFKKFLLILAIFIFLLSILIVDILVKYRFTSSDPNASSDKFIVYNPVNLTQIESISKFRSCQGHDFSAKNISGVIETNRSMKHYITPVKDLRNERNLIEVYAPFDGKIIFSIDEGRSNQIDLTPDFDKNWSFFFMHVDLLESVKVGDSVEGGQLIGYANTENAHDFDMGLVYRDNKTLIEKLSLLITSYEHFPLQVPNVIGYYDSPFNYMTDEVLAEFQKYNELITGGYMSYSKESRDSNECNFDKAASYKDDWVYIQEPEEPVFQPVQQSPLVVPEGIPPALY